MLSADQQGKMLGAPQGAFVLTWINTQLFTQNAKQGHFKRNEGVLNDNE